jgi:hypothetical protein
MLLQGHRSRRVVWPFIEIALFRTIFFLSLFLFWWVFFLFFFSYLFYELIVLNFYCFKFVAILWFLSAGYSAVYCKLINFRAVNRLPRFPSVARIPLFWMTAFGIL